MPSLVVGGRGADAGHAGAHRGLADSGRRHQAIPDALIADLRAHGGELVARRGGHRTARPAWCSTTPHRPRCCGIYGDRLPPRYAKALRRYRFGPGVAKVDFVLSGEIPWRDPRLAAGADTAPGRHPRPDGAAPNRRSPQGRHAEWPMVLAALPHLADPGRIDAQGRRPLWTYAHVPSGSTVDQTETVTDDHRTLRPRLPRYRRRRCAACRPHGWPTTTPTYVGGDIGVGGNTMFSALTGPTPRRQPVVARRSRRPTCARRRRRRAAACTAWPATTPRARCCAASSASRPCPQLAP